MERSLDRRSAHRLSPQLAAVVDLHAQQALADFVLQLEPGGLESTKMMLKVLRRIESSFLERGRHLSRDELLCTLDTLIRDSETRQRIVELYQEGCLESSGRLLE